MVCAERPPMLATCVAATTMPDARAQSAYSIVDVGLPPGRTNVTPKRLSPDGRAIVYSNITGGGTRSYLWSNGVFQDLGSYDAALYGATRRRTSTARARSQGSSWGSGYPARMAADRRGVLTRADAGWRIRQRLLHQRQWADDGVDRTGPANFFAYLFDGSRIVNLGRLPGGVFSTGYSVNENGEVASDAAAEFQPQLGGPPSRASAKGCRTWARWGAHAWFARAINAHGHITGYSDIACNGTADAGLNPSHAFLWRDGVMVDLRHLAGMVVSVGHASTTRTSLSALTTARTGTPRKRPAAGWMGRSGPEHAGARGERLLHQAGRVHQQRGPDPRQRGAKQPVPCGHPYTNPLTVPGGTFYCTARESPALAGKEHQVNRMQITLRHIILRISLRSILIKLWISWKK